jgi:hypothetical protein
MAEIKRIATAAASSPSAYQAILPMARNWVAEAEAIVAALPRRRTTAGRYDSVAAVFKNFLPPLDF